jgi:hypothetical protein
MLIEGVHRHGRRPSFDGRQRGPVRDGALVRRVYNRIGNIVATGTNRARTYNAKTHKVLNYGINSHEPEGAFLAQSIEVDLQVCGS